MELSIKKDKLEKYIESIKDKLSEYNREKLFKIEILKECFKMTESSNSKKVIISNEINPSEIFPSAPSHEILIPSPSYEIAIAEVIDEKLMCIV